jgi:hypothetical protein
VNGQPAAAIIAVHRNGEAFVIQPLFVSIMPVMVLADHESGLARP